MTGWIVPSGIAAWLLVGFAVAVRICRGIHRADHQAGHITDPDCCKDTTR